MNNDKIQKVLDMQEEGKSIKEIADTFKYKSYKNLQDYMRKKGYCCIDGKFKLKEDSLENEVSNVSGADANNIDEVNETPKADTTKEDPEVIEIAKAKKSKSVTNNELKVSLDDLKNDIEVIKYYMMEETYKVRFELPMKNSEKSSPTSVRLYKDDKESFDMLCKTKFKDINKDALFSMALREFVEKYGDN